ncbi:endonuclease/exonuclease/phosphatase family protein [Daejeonella lutea]|uniref:Metal-dependent hydrolase, endonuclease/exonuclease/phosphatase family n=1 Tax=Daejeonella lutea TaxID=572036 RepID=A0A1T4ZZ37_9SPHI|nr:endonuclease/exonuclease/phosphatase family protein [Daejeonella lutea]SKB27787.1 Metal-dependent hydrolase, endonuclease/exonuclease/phosphatase family [Daejeonella lutea]
MKKIILLFILINFSAEIRAQQNKYGSLNVLSYNIRYNNPRDSVNAWPNRKEWVKSLVKFYDTDILCIQEGLSDQVDFLQTATGFAVEGVGRDDGKRAGEFAAIYYNPNRFVKRVSGHFWLSETPEVPSKGWDAAIVRLCTWVRLYDKERKQEFFVFNTHYDHMGAVARLRSSELIQKQIPLIAGDLPVILTGDLNVTPETESVATIKTFLSDAREVSMEPPYGPQGSFNAFNFNAPLKERIDYIFTSRQFKVLKYGILSDSKDQRYPSDHLPVLARVRIE